MERNFQTAFKLMLKHEGGWSDNPNDPGGATMKGVTLATFRRLVKPDATKADLRKITDAQLQIVYRHSFWDEVLGSKLPNGVDYAVFDFAVNSGPKRAVQFLQRILGVKDDGRIGPVTLQALTLMPPNEVVFHLCTDRLKWLKTLKGWPHFGKGWSRRVAEVEREATKMAQVPETAPEVVVEEKEVVPARVEKEVREKTNWLSYITGFFGAGGLGASWLAGMDKDGLILITGGTLTFIIVMLVGGEWIIRRVRKIKEAVEE